MDKLLFISNITNSITNFCIPSYLACEKLNIEFHLASNLDGFNNIEKSYKNINLHNIKCGRSPFSLKNFHAYKEVCKIIEENNITYIHCNTPIGGILGRLCGRKYKVKKVIYTAHGFHFYSGASVFNKLLFKTAEKMMARLTDCLITMNEEDYLAAKKMHLKKGGYVYKVPGVGINTNEFFKIMLDKEIYKKNLGLKKEDFICIGVGDLVKNKNFETTIKAIKYLNMDNVHYLICGDGPERENLNKLVREINIVEQVHFLGFRQDIKELLAISDCFLFASLREGLPRSTMEAMATGLPCIVSKIRGNVDLIDEQLGGFCVSKKDFVSFSNSLKHIIESQSLREKMGQYNMNKIKNFDINIVCEKILDIYKNIL